MKAEPILLEYELTTHGCKIYLDGEVIGYGNSALFDGARMLLSLGYDPETLMTTKSTASQYNSWTPKPISEWAKLTVKERKSGALSVETFVAFPGATLQPRNDILRVHLPEQPFGAVRGAIS